MTNYFSYSKEEEKTIEWKINNKNAICYVSECSKDGGILPKGIQVFQDNKSLNNDNKRPLCDIIEMIKFILNSKESIADFVIYCNKPEASKGEKKQCIVNERKRIGGTCFKLTGFENYETKPVLELPKLYALANKIDDDNINCICFYGDKPKLEDCIHVAMHICGDGTLENRTKFIFLTPVPDEWYINTL